MDMADEAAVEAAAVAGATVEAVVGGGVTVEITTSTRAAGAHRPGGRTLRRFQGRGPYRRWGDCTETQYYSA